MWGKPYEQRRNLVAVVCKKIENEAGDTLHPYCESCFRRRLPSTRRDESRRSRGKKVFSKKSSKCHTIERAGRWGPDLRGLTQRRPMGYLVDLISNATHMFATGNPLAIMVLEQ